MADYVAQNRRESNFDSTRYASVTVPSSNQPKTPLELMATRENYVYQARADQIEVNQLSATGGYEYINRRLSRFPAESTIEWSGGRRRDGSYITGRKQQAFCIPYLSRIVEKINQYVIGSGVKRDGIDPELESNITKTGQSLNYLMRDVNSYLTTSRWCWIGIDAPALTGESMSELEREESGIRPYWQVYSPLEVKDWAFDNDGSLLWLITESKQMVDNGPEQPTACQTIRRIWEPGRVRTIALPTDNNNAPQIISDIQIGYNGVPFVLVGNLSPHSYMFDNLESINRTIMDLSSCNRQNFFNTVFPQMYLPASMIDTINESFGVNAEEGVLMVKGLGYPILLQQGDVTPGYITPDTSALGSIKDEMNYLRNEMFETVGLMLRQESRAAISAESKAWDFLDINAVMRERASILQEAEKKAIAISAEFDPAFSVWIPEYNTKFDATNFEREIESIVKSSTVDMPDEMKAFLLKQLFEAIKKSSGVSIEASENESIINAITAFAQNDAITVKLTDAINQARVSGDQDMNGDDMPMKS